MSIALDCERRWSAGSVTVRLQHTLASDPARAGTPVEPQGDLVPVDWDEVSSGGGGFGFSAGTGASRTYGDEPISSRNDASWGATLLVPLALLVAALVMRREKRSS